MSDPFQVLVTYVDGQLVHVDDGSPVPELGPWKVCENTLFAERERERRARLMARLTPHERAMIRRRKRKRGGPR